MKANSRKSASFQPFGKISLILAFAALAHPGKSSAATNREGFYKDIFVDAGVALTANLPGAEKEPGMNHMGLSMDFTYTADKTTQNKIMVKSTAPDWMDDNGALLYPDRSPRFRMIYIHGGDSKNHGASLDTAGRKIFRDFVKNGGSYAGSCAGWYIASEGDSLMDKYQYFGFWPAHVVRTHVMIDSSMGWKIPNDSPLLKYNDFGGDHYIAKLKHWNGPYTISDDKDYWTPGTEILARYDYPGHPMNGNVSVAAYKPDAQTGRLVMIGSHPELFYGGERQAVFEAALSYALDGQGAPRIKGQLQEGVLRSMNDNSVASHEKIGDKQYHHFTLNVDPGTTYLTLNLNGKAGFDLFLYAKHGDFAFKGDSGVSSAEATGPTQTLTLHNPEPGTWYVGVKCNTTVTSDTVVISFPNTRYSGKTEVLNGIAYSLKYTQVGGTAGIPAPAYASGNEYGMLLANASIPNLDRTRVDFKLYNPAGHRVGAYGGLGKDLRKYLEEKASAKGTLYYRLQLLDATQGADKSKYEGNLTLRP